MCSTFFIRFAPINVSPGRFFPTSRAPRSLFLHRHSTTRASPSWRCGLPKRGLVQSSTSLLRLDNGFKKIGSIPQSSFAVDQSLHTARRYACARSPYTTSNFGYSTLESRPQSPDQRVPRYGWLDPANAIPKNVDGRRDPHGFVHW